MGGGGRGRPRGSENNCVKAGGVRSQGHPAQLPAVCAEVLRPLLLPALRDTGHGQLPRRPWRLGAQWRYSGAGLREALPGIGPVSVGHSAGKPRASAPSAGRGSGSGARETGFGTAGHTGAASFPPRRSHAVVRGVLGAGGGGVNRPQLSSPGPRLAAPFCLCSLAISVFPVRCP